MTIVITITGNGNTLKNIIYNGKNLKLNRDYTINGNKITFKDEYLDTLKLGEHTITFDMNRGSSPKLSVTIREEKETEIYPLVNVDWLGYWTFAVGVEGAFSLPMFGNIVNENDRVAYGMQVVIDDNFNIWILVYEAEGIGTPALSISGIVSVSSADRIKDLEGEAAVIGSSSSFGLEAFAGKARDRKDVAGGTFSMGSSLVAEAHSETTYTKVYTVEDGVKLLEKVTMQGKEWVLDKLYPFGGQVKDVILSAVLPIEAYAAECGVDRSVKNINAPANLNKVKMEREKVTTSIANDVRARNTANIAGKAAVTVPNTKSSTNSANKAIAISPTKTNVSGSGSKSASATKLKKA